jgi:uncharacterized membrane protein YqgA involved in biofilm formation
VEHLIGFGTILNSVSILVGGLAGHFAGRLFRERQQEALNRACGVSILFIAVAGAMEGMLKIESGALTAGKSMLVVLCLSLGTVIGELIGVEDAFERFGEWLKRKTGNSGDARFVHAFVTASLTVSIGAMAVVGAIQDGLSGDSSVLVTKSILDFVIVMVMTSTLGKGCAFAAIPVLAVEGSLTLLARLIAPIMTDAALANLSMVGSMLIFCVGLNLTFGKRIRVANLLPALILAVASAFLPVGL